MGLTPAAAFATLTLRRMSERIVGWLCVGGGLSAVSVGWLLARSRLKRARRRHRKRRLIHAAMPEGWGVWFFQGFSDVTLGARWLVAVFVLVFWVALGVGLVSLGVHLGW